MKRRRFSHVVGIIFLLVVSLAWTACQSRLPAGGGSLRDNEPTQPADSDLAAKPQPAQTDTPTATTLPPTNTRPAPTATPPPTITPRPTRTPIPTATYTATPSPTPTRVTFIDSVDRTCPDPAPLRPEYDRYYLPAQRWPAPNAGGADHFWLSKPLPGGGRLLFTDWFPYGYDAGGRYLLHNGIDVSEPLGTPVLAAADGTVVVAGDDFNRLYGWRCDWYGHLVVVELDDRWLDQPVYLLYGHVLEISVEVGDHVLRGEQVAEVGIGGAATLPHLHFEVRVGSNEFGSTRNPLLWLIPPSTRGLVAGRLVDPEGRPWQGVAVNALGQSEETENYTSWTYLGDPQELLNPDETLAENFVIGDMRPGRYRIVVVLQGVEYQAEVEVVAGQLSTVEIVTETFKTPTPQPESTPTSESPAEPTPAE